MKRFWMVYVNGRQGSTQKHLSDTAAREEAERLARLPENRGRDVYLLRAVWACNIPETPVIWSVL